MGQKLLIGPFNKGLRNDVTAFNIDNDSFPLLMNAYQWRGRIKRKRGTTLLGRLQRDDISVAGQALTAGVINLITALGLESTSQIVPGSIDITGLTDGTTYTDPALDGVLVAAGGTGTGGSINYATGVLSINAGGNQFITGTFSYYPGLPVMGLETFVSQDNTFPGTVAFDTTYSYDISTSNPFPIHDVSFYKNPAASASLPAYAPKTTLTPLTWNGQDYQQFWTENYLGAMWTCNGITGPFSTANIGLQLNTITAIAIGAGGPPAIVTITTTLNHGLVAGDFVYLNEIVGMTGINYQAGYVTATPAVNQITVELPNATVAGVYGSGGIVQYLTNRIDATKDCIRFYDGDPTTTNKGWVNFMPPLSNLPYSIGDLPPAQYYLAGARMIKAFKDRLLFLGPVIQSAGGSPLYLKDVVIYSENGSPYYTSSFTSSGTNYPLFSDANGFNPILLPSNQTAVPAAYFEDVTGYGGFIAAGVDQDILTLGENEDVLIVGFTNIETRLVYSGNDLIPFNFYIINTELGSGSTFSAITLDKGVISRGSRGFIITSQTTSSRIDVIIPDEVFEMRLLDNGAERMSAQRDYINEWIYFTYPVNNINYKFPTQTLLFNYRDNTWGIFRESYTTYGPFRRQSGQTWATLSPSLTWDSWTEPWNAGSSTLLQPEVIAGNQQGFVLFREQDGTGEGVSLFISAITGSTVTSPNHCLNNGDYILIQNCLGTVGAQVNNKVFSVSQATTNTFVLVNPLTGGPYTYLGSGVIKRFYVPQIKTKQFPVFWEGARKTRIGVQQYLLSKTTGQQITLLIFLSQDATVAYNNLNFPYPVQIVPNVSQNNSLIYSTILYTCPESTNLGLTPANINLQMVSAGTQSQIWHRMNTSLLGDTVQVGFTLNDDQMRDPNLLNQTAEIELHSIIMDLSPSQLLA